MAAGCPLCRRQLGAPSRRALVGRVCKLTEVVNLQHSDDGETMCMARRRRAAGQGSSWRESQPAPPLICCFASRLSHLLFLLRGVAPAAWLEKEGGSGREQGGRSRGGPGRFWNLDPNRCPRRQTTRLNQTGDRTTEIRRQRGLTCARFGRKSRVKFRLLKIVHFEI